MKVKCRVFGLIGSFVLAGCETSTLLDTALPSAGSADARNSAAESGVLLPAPAQLRGGTSAPAPAMGGRSGASSAPPAPQAGRGSQSGGATAATNSSGSGAGQGGGRARRRGAAGAAAGEGGVGGMGGAVGLARAGTGGAGGVGTGGKAGAASANMSGAGGAGCVADLRCQLPALPSTGDAHQDCVDRINQFREQCACLPPLARWRDGEACADEMAKYDSAGTQAHAAFGAKICEGGSAQNECPGWRSESQIVDQCLQKMWDEGPPPMSDCTGSCFQMYGHFLNMTNQRMTKVACGFYQTSDGQFWSVQNFSR